jgi:hypothetical protein
MRNSAWYHKLWRNKFDSLPVKDISDASWTGMHKLLNEQMPVSPISGHGPNLSTGAKLFKVIGYTLSVAATVSTVGYFAVQKSKNKHKENIKNVKPVRSDSIPVDSSKVLNYNEIADTTLSRDSIGIHENAINNAVVQGRDSLSGIQRVNENAINVSSNKPPHAAPSVGNKQTGTERSYIVSASGNVGVKSSKPGSRVDVYGYTNQKTDSSFANSNSLLLMPNGFQQGNGFSGALPSAIVIFDQKAVLQMYTAKELQNSSSGKGDSRSSQNNKRAGRITLDKNQKVKNIRLPKFKTARIKRDNTDPTFTYGITTGVNVQKGNSSFYGGIFGAYALGNKWQLAVGVNINSYQKIVAEFTHPSYYRPDSVPPFTIAATRKVITMDIPLTAAYKLSKHISVKAGPVISFVGKQSEMITKLNPIADPRDTLYHSKTIDSTIVNTVNNKVHIGFTGGISIHIKQFDINGSYQWLAPYKVSNSLGTFKQSNQVFRIGIGYRFK